MGRLSKLLGVSSKNDTPNTPPAASSSRASDRALPALPTPPQSQNNTASSRYSGTTLYTSNSATDSVSDFSPPSSSHDSPQTSSPNLSTNSRHNGSFPMHARSNSNELLPPKNPIYNTNRYSRSLTLLPGRDGSPVHSDRSQPNRIVDSTEDMYSSNITKVRTSRNNSRPGTSGTDFKPGGTALAETPASLLTWRWTDRGREVASYHFGPLGRGEKVPDLYNPDGDTVVYLAMKGGEFSRTPSFRINSSPLMHTMLEEYIKPVGGSMITPSPSVTTFDSTQVRPSTSRHVSSEWKYGTGSRPESPGNAYEEESQGLQEVTAQYQIFWPHSEPSGDAIESLRKSIDSRNLFAFLDKSFLVGAKGCRETVYEILEDLRDRIINSVPEIKGKSKRRRGRAAQLPLEEAQPALAWQASDLGLDDVRYDNEKMLRILKLAEDWHHDGLYHDVFIHCVGNWETAKLKDHPLVATISKSTIEHIEKSVIDLENKVRTVTNRIQHFKFSSLEHTLSKEKWCEKSWKGGFLAMKRLTLDHYNYLYGTWPPKPMKNGRGQAPLTKTGGLNRLTLQQVYNDFIGLYELLVDHNSKYMETAVYEPTVDVEKNLLKILAEFDASDLPNQPPMPFALPLIPKVPERLKNKKKLAMEDIVSMYEETGYNKFNYPEDRRLIDAYKKLEMKSSQADLAGLRQGRWIFIYAVLQSLVLTACDAPNLKYTDSVEYFLCEGARLGSAPPWQASGRSRPLSMIMLGDMATAKNLGDVEVTYESSRCWQLAKQWRQELDPDTSGSVRSEGYSDMPSGSVGRDSSSLRNRGTPPPPINTLQPPVMSSQYVHEPANMSPGAQQGTLPPPVRWVAVGSEHSPQVFQSSGLGQIEEYGRIVASPPPQLIVGGHHYTYQEPMSAPHGRRVFSETIQQQTNRAMYHDEVPAHQGVRRFSAPFTGYDGTRDSNSSRRSSNSSQPTRPPSTHFDQIIPGLERMSQTPGLYGKTGVDGMTPPRSPSPSISAPGSPTFSPRTAEGPGLGVVSPRIPTPKFNKFSWEPVQESKLKDVIVGSPPVGNAN